MLYFYYFYAPYPKICMTFFRFGSEKNETPRVPQPSQVEKRHLTSSFGKRFSLLVAQKILISEILIILNKNKRVCPFILA